MLYHTEIIGLASHSQMMLSPIEIHRPLFDFAVFFDETYL